MADLTGQGPIGHELEEHRRLLNLIREDIARCEGKLDTITEACFQDPIEVELDEAEPDHRLSEILERLELIAGHLSRLPS